MRPRYLLALLLLPTFAAADGFATSSLRQVPTTPSASDVMADLTINLYSHQAEPVVRGESGGASVPDGPVVEMIVTDSAGHRTGHDPVRKCDYNEIANGSYYLRGDGTTRQFLVAQPLSHVKTGIYKIQVIGTGRGSYDLEVTRLVPESGGHMFSDTGAVEHVHINPGQIHLYRFNYTMEKSVPLKLERMR